ncbi:hypothetical protein [Nonomuraea sp. NPDC049709]|uniref:hypothetical protein n=1 Tax=Nonomuraea sp. NPDC049709 TaxID=3154736 RepID=UPI0034438D4A
MSDAAMGGLWFALIVFMVVFLLAWDRARHRLSTCRRCTGGRIYSPFSDRWRDCPLCNGTGVRGRR